MKNKNMVSRQKARSGTRMRVKSSRVAARFESTRGSQRSAPVCARSSACTRNHASDQSRFIWLQFIFFLFPPVCLRRLTLRFPYQLTLILPRIFRRQLLTLLLTTQSRSAFQIPRLVDPCKQTPHYHTTTSTCACLYSFQLKPDHQSKLM
jgi:hypothetical protein